MKALHVTSYTLIGVFGEPPHDHGNCFSIEADDGKCYHVVNFVYENIEALEKLGLQFPLEIERLADGVVALMDPRIGERWYRDTFCEICCPRDLLPVTQRQRHKRDISRGRRVEGNGFVSINFDVPSPPFE